MGLLECSVCGKFKPSSQFHKDASSSTGYRSCCKSCRKLQKEQKTTSSQEVLDYLISHGNVCSACGKKTHDLEPDIKAGIVVGMICQDCCKILH